MKFLFLPFLLFSFLPAFSQGSLESDRLALIALYNAMSGPNWFQKTGWNPSGVPGDNPCSWYGVTCEGGRVTKLNLLESGVDGSIPLQIGNLDQLKSLILGWTIFTDARLAFNPPYNPIPNEIGNLSNLEYLDLSGVTENYNENIGGIPLPGPLPASLGKLTKLTYLNLASKARDMQYHGFLTGAIPKELGNLANLKYLNFGGQNFSGRIPEELGNLAKLEYLDLGGASMFTGTIPASFSKLSNLKVLDLSYFDCCVVYHGTLGGPIPDLSGIPASARVSIRNNAFTFDGLDVNISRIDSYGGQAKIKLNHDVSLNQLTAEAGGIIANNTYKWFRNSILVATIAGNKNYNPAEEGTYRAEVTNSAVPDLTLVTENQIVATLPVTLVSFSGHEDGQVNSLFWKTSVETNNRGFEIERSIDARIFEKIGFVDGGGETRQLKEYTFTDKNPIPKNYYRLKQWDFDGKSEYSRVIFVKGSFTDFVIYPNPVKDHIFIKNLTQSNEVVIRNLAGKIMLKQIAEPGKPVQTLNLMPGLYTITVAGKVQNIVIQK